MRLATVIDVALVAAGYTIGILLLLAMSALLSLCGCASQRVIHERDPFRKCSELPEPCASKPDPECPCRSEATAAWLARSGNACTR